MRVWLFKFFVISSLVGTYLFAIGCEDSKKSALDGGLSFISCSGVSCWEPPDQTCEEGRDNSLNVYNSAGWCESGDCFYASRDEDCQIGLCKGGFCEEVPCQGMTCGDPPDSVCADETTIIIYSPVGYCAATGGIPQCRYADRGVPCEEGCQDGVCGGDPCMFKICNKPPSRFCDGDQVVVWEPQGACEDGECVYNSQTVSCGGSCSEGHCVNKDPCAVVTCNSQPASFCTNSDTLRVFESKGSCAAASCIYTYQDITCNTGCADGQCIGEECVGVICDIPFSSYCGSGGALTHWDGSDGLCEEGVCTYITTSTGCSPVCSDGRCPDDPCVGVFCTTSPSGYCVDETTVVDYQDRGSCEGGTCFYQAEPSLCEMSCAGGACTAEERCPTNIPDPWVHQAYLKSENNQDGDYFGYPVAIDGDTLVVAASNENSLQGGVYVFVRSGVLWSLEAYLIAPVPNGEAGDLFGYSVAIAGDTIVVGAIHENSTTTGIINDTDLGGANELGSDNGAAYVFKRTGTIWALEAYLKAPNNNDGDFFGASVAVSGDTIAVGAIFEDSNTQDIINEGNPPATDNDGTQNGAVYVFTRTGSDWAYQAYLKAPNTTDGDEFGSSVAMDGETVVVGVRLEDSSTGSIIPGDDLSTTNDGGNNNGAVYVFNRTGSIWVHQAYLKAPNTSGGDQFGISTAIDADTVVVGAMYEDSATTGIIHGADLSAADDSGNENGAAYVFRRTGSVWAHQAYLKAPNSGQGDVFSNVSISGEMVVVGAAGEDGFTTDVIQCADLYATDNNGNLNGAAYVFVRNSSTWTHQAYLKAPNNDNGDAFGFSTAISGDTIVIGAPYEKSTTSAIINGDDLSATNNDGISVGDYYNGAAYVFRH